MTWISLIVCCKRLCFPFIYSTGYPVCCFLLHSAYGFSRKKENVKRDAVAFFESAFVPLIRMYSFWPWEHSELSWGLVIVGDSSLSQTASAYLFSRHNEGNLVFMVLSLSSFACRQAGYGQIFASFSACSFQQQSNLLTWKAEGHDASPP